MFSRLRAAFPGGRILLPTTAAVQVSAMLRSIVVARLLGPEQFGIAVTFILVQQFLDAALDTGLNKFLLQHRHGDRPVAQAMVQMVSVARGVLLAAIILLLLRPLGARFGLSDDLLPYLLLASLPLSFSLVHFDNYRQQRRGQFFNDSMAQALGELACLIVTVLLAVWTRSYISVVAGLAVRIALSSLISHLLATRPYRLRWSPMLWPALRRFSLPLMLNGPLLFFSMQGDRMLVTATLGLRELGLYSATLLLIGSPATLLLKLTSSFYMPRLAAADRQGALAQAERRFTGAMIALFLLMVTGFAAVAPFAVRLLYGEDYVQEAALVALIGSVQGIRFLRGWPVNLAVAVGATGSVLTSNLARFIFALSLGLLGALSGQGLAAVAGGFLVGEIIALILSQLQLNWKRRLPVLHGMFAMAVATGAAVLLPLAVWLLPAGLLAPVASAAGTLAVAVALLHWRDPGLLPRNREALR